MPSSGLLTELRELAPWHFNIEVAPGLRTIDGNYDESGNARFGRMPVVNPTLMRPLLQQLYPGGLRAKSFLDAGCNAGGYCFLAKEMGAVRTLGFDAREHWIAQAEFLKRHSRVDTSGMRFKTATVGSVDVDEQFDITMFKGILYHLPDPVSSLSRVAELTREVIIIDTETEGELGEFTLRLRSPKRELLMAGVDRLAWFPSAPDLVAHLARWVGFTEVREIQWRRKEAPGRSAAGRCRLVAARSAEVLEDFDRAR